MSNGFQESILPVERQLNEKEYLPATGRNDMTGTSPSMHTMIHSMVTSGLLVGAALVLLMGCATKASLSPRIIPKAVQTVTRQQIKTYFGTNSVTGVPLLDPRVDWLDFAHWPDEFHFRGGTYQIHVEEYHGDYFKPLPSRSEIKQGMSFYANYQLNASSITRRLANWSVTVPGPTWDQERGSTDGKERQSQARSSTSSQWTTSTHIKGVCPEPGVVVFVSNQAPRGPSRWAVTRFCAPSTSRPDGRSVSSMSQTLQYLTDAHGDRTAVVLPISEYEKLMEDLGDLTVAAERRDEPLIPHEEFIAELKRDGIL